MVCEKACPNLDRNLNVVESLAAIRQGQATVAGKKVLIVLDQFEQWLHAKKEEENTELVQALRQCDGSDVQCIVMVRDDFWMAVSRFLRELEVRLVEGENQRARRSVSISTMPTKSWRRSGGHLGSCPKLTRNIDGAKAVHQAIGGGPVGRRQSHLCSPGPVCGNDERQTMDASDTLAEVGGTSGVGVTFLEETFSASTAPPEHRLHQKAARAVLKALLPDSGTDIKGEMKSREELLQTSGYASRPKDFDDLIRILDSEIRLITPTDPEGIDSDDESSVPTKCWPKILPADPRLPGAIRCATG